MPHFQILISHLKLFIFFSIIFFESLYDHKKPNTEFQCHTLIIFEKTT